MRGFARLLLLVTLQPLSVESALLFQAAMHVVTHHWTACVLRACASYSISHLGPSLKPHLLLYNRVLTSSNLRTDLALLEPPRVASCRPVHAPSMYLLAFLALVPCMIHGKGSAHSLFVCGLWLQACGVSTGTTCQQCATS